MPKGFIIKRNNLTKDTLRKIAIAGVIVVAATTSPYFLSHVIEHYFHDRSKKAAQARARKLYELKRRKLLSFKELGAGKVHIELSHYGKKLVRRYDLEDMRLQKPKRWDGWWRVIIFDIPERDKWAREGFREKLKVLGLFQLQKSVFVTPYPCEEEVSFLVSVFSIASFVRLLKTKDLSADEELCSYFGVPRPLSQIWKD